MHHQCVAPLAANSPHSGWSRAISIASSKVRLCRDRSFFRVAIQEERGRPTGLLQSLWGTAVGKKFGFVFVTLHRTCWESSQPLEQSELVLVPPLLSPLAVLLPQILRYSDTLFWTAVVWPSKCRRIKSAGWHVTYFVNWYCCYKAYRVKWDGWKNVVGVDHRGRVPTRFVSPSKSPPIPNMHRAEYQKQEKTLSWTQAI